jgi:hypothetical protein
MGLDQSHLLPTTLVVEVLAAQPSSSRAQDIRSIGVSFSRKLLNSPRSAPMTIPASAGAIRVRRTHARCGFMRYTRRCEMRALKGLMFWSDTHWAHW